MPWTSLTTPETTNGNIQKSADSSNQRFKRETILLMPGTPACSHWCPVTNTSRRKPFYWCPGLLTAAVDVSTWIVTLLFLWCLYVCKVCAWSVGWKSPTYGQTDLWRGYLTRGFSQIWCPLVRGWWCNMYVTCIWWIILGISCLKCIINKYSEYNKHSVLNSAII